MSEYFVITFVRKRECDTVPEVSGLNLIKKKHVLVSVHRLFPPPSLTKETTSSSPESSSEEEGPHGSSTEGTLQLPASSQGSGGGRVGGSSPTKRRSPHDTNKSALHTYRVTNNDASLQPHRYIQDVLTLGMNGLCIQWHDRFNGKNGRAQKSAKTVVSA